jgi:hypothetical protein
MLAANLLPASNRSKSALFWYFGDKAGLSFVGGTPVPLTNSTMFTEEGTALLALKMVSCFYTNGVGVWG